MRGSWKIGRIFGFPVELHFTFVLLLVLAGIFGGMEMAGMLILVFASVLVHELGHSVVSRSLGIPISGITLFPFGGMAQMTEQPSPRQELFIAAAGPATSIVIGAFSAMAWVVSGLYFFGVLASINFILGIFNLLPALPMDGGRILRSVLAKKMGMLKATIISGRLARILAVLLAVSAFSLGPMALVVALLVWWMAGQEIRAAKLRSWSEGVNPGRVSSGGFYQARPYNSGVYDVDADLNSLLNEIREQADAYRNPSRHRGSGKPQVPASRVIIDVPSNKS